MSIGLILAGGLGKEEVIAKSVRLDISAHSSTRTGGRPWREGRWSQYESRRSRIGRQRKSADLNLRRDLFLISWRLMHIYLMAIYISDAYISDGRLANANLHARTCLHTNKDIYKLQHLPPLLPLQTVMHSNTTKPFESKITIWIPDIVIRVFSSCFFILNLDLFFQKIEKYSWRLSLRSNSTTGWKSMCKRSAMTRHFWQHYINCWFTSSISIHKPFFWHHYTNLVCKISSQLQNYVSYWQTLICGFVLSWWQVMMLHSRLQEQQK